MEIILALMALAATPFGAAMLDKPTRKRFVKYVEVHVTGPEGKVKETVRKYQSPVAGVVQSVTPLEKRSTDHWKADGALQALWQEAFVFLAIKGQDAEFNRVLTTMEKHDRRLAQYKADVKAYEDMYDRARSSSSYSSFSHRHRVEEALKGHKRTLARELAICDSEYTENQKVIRDLIVKYDLKSMDELRYKNDLVRLATGKKLPTFDYVALTAYTVNK